MFQGETHRHIPFGRCCDKPNFEIGGFFQIEEALIPHLLFSISWIFDHIQVRCCTQGTLSTTEKQAWASLT